MRLWMLVSVFYIASSAFAMQNSASIPKKEGVYIFEDKTQKSTWRDGVREGMTWWYNDHGGIKSQVNFKNGKEEGLYTSFYDNGKKRLEVPYVHGQKHGLQIIYYDNGVKGAEVMYVNGRKEGVEKEWDHEGDLYSEVYYKNNYKVGLKKYYDKDGNVIRTETYEMDRNPVMVRLLKDKAKEIDVDLAKYGLVPSKK